MTQSFAFNPHASQEANEGFVRSLRQEEEPEGATCAEVTESEHKPVLNLKPRRQRARVEDGKFAGDNPDTPQNEAWQE